MSLDTWTLHVLTVLALMSTPGPSQLLMLSTSAVHGFHRALATAAGDLSANALQMLAAGLGLATLLATSATALSVTKMGRSGLPALARHAYDAEHQDGQSEPRGCSSTRVTQALWMQGFTTSAANPKAVVFFAALFPQFISADAAFWPQFVTLSVTYLVLDALFLSTYGCGARWVVARFKGTARLWVERIGGGFMIVAAILLGLKSLARP